MNTTATMFKAGEAGMVQASEHWYRCKQNYQGAIALYRRHYSCRHGRYDLSHSIVGPGERVVLITADEDALFVWRRELYRMDGQDGVNCAVFRNEGDVLSSDLIIEAERIAWERWPGERLFTFVNAGRIRSINPGCCFKRAGWSRCGETQTGLLVLEKAGVQLDG